MEAHGKQDTDLRGGGDWEEEILWLAKKIVYNDPASNHVFKGRKETRGLVPKEKSLLFGAKNKGLPIGNLTSQFFANVYLNEMDHFIRDELGFERYVRYVDDFVILDEDPYRLRAAEVKISVFLREHLCLSLCADKTVLLPISAGIDFLGYFVKPTHTLVRRKVVRRFKRILYERRSGEDGLFDICDIPMLRSYEGHFIHAHSFNLRRKLGE